MPVYAALFTAVLFWGLSFIWTKTVLNSFDVYSLIFIRFLTVTVILGIIIKASSLSLSFKWHEQRFIFLTALFQPFLYFIFETNSLKIINASIASLIAATIPIFVAIVSIILKREGLNITTSICSLLSFTGIYMLVQNNLGSSALPNHTSGILMMFGAVLSAVFYIIVVNKIGRSIHVLRLTFFQMLYGTILLAPFFINSFNIEVIVGASKQAILSLGALIIFSTLASFLSYNFAISKLTPAKVSLYLNAVPVITIIAAFLILGERLSLLQLTGAGIVLLSLYILSSKKNNSEYKIRYAD